MRRLLFALSLLLAAPRMEAALVESALTGRVTSGDTSVSGASVTVLSLARKSEWHAVTNDRGVYWLSPLPAGEYDVTFSRAGLVTLTRRAVVEMGRVERVDAQLDPSDDDETVTSTTRSVHAGSTTAITTHFAALELERLPLRGKTAAVGLAPSSLLAHALVDGASTGAPFLGDEAVDQMTVVRGAASAELDAHTLVLVRTRSGGDELHATLRGTWSETRHRRGGLLESSSGGSIVRERLWFFAAGWGGDAAYAGAENARGVDLAVDAHITDSQRVEARWLDSDGSGFGSSAATVRYAATVTPRLLAHAFAGRTSENFREQDRLGARLSYAAAAHVISAGTDDTGQTALFLADRFSAGDWTVNAGVRARDDGSSFDVMPRIAATYDLRGDGRHSLSASFGEFDGVVHSSDSTRLFATGYTMALDQFASVRADYLHYDGAVSGDSLQAEARMRLFDRVETGATYGYHDVSGADVIRDGHQGAIWGGLQLPLGDYEAGFTLMERYERGWSTDVALRLIVPFSRLTATFAADVINAFDTDAQDGRAVRIWARVGL